MPARLQHIVHGVVPLRLFTCLAWGVWLVCLLSGAAVAMTQQPSDVVEVRYPRPESVLDRRWDYLVALVSEALRVTEPAYGKAVLVPTEKPLPAGRAVELLQEGRDELDVMFRAMTWTLRDRLLWVPVPLDKGLLGYRVLLIRKEDQPRFAAVRTVEDLRAFTTGMRHDWYDLPVWESASFRVVAGNSYEGLFRMLVAGRFDFFPRGVDEVYEEWEARRELLPTLAVEETLLVHYPYGRYAWFADTPKGHMLRRRVADGLETLQRNGTFDTMFKDYVSLLEDRLKLSSRRVIELGNPYLPPDNGLGGIFGAYVPGR